MSNVIIHSVDKIKVVISAVRNISFFIIFCSFQINSESYSQFLTCIVYARIVLIPYRFGWPLYLSYCFAVFRLVLSFLQCFLPFYFDSALYFFCFFLCYCCLPFSIVKSANKKKKKYIASFI